MLEFLGGIDEVNDASSPEDNFSDFLATADIDHIAASGKEPKSPPPKDDKNAKK
jgi:hypothetical protein